MEKFKLTLDAPGAIGSDPIARAAWKATSEKIIEVLNQKYGLNDEECMCGSLIGETFSSSQVKDITLLALGTDWPGRVLQVSTLRFRGNGPCPDCGSDQAEEELGGLDRDEFGQLYQRVLAYTCKNCRKLYYPETE